jgi:fatty-acyl-CoA synthase
MLGGGGPQQWPLVTSTILRHAWRTHAEQTVVSVTVEGAVHRQTYADVYERCVRLALALARLGCVRGDVVATLAWNTHRHLECWCAAAAALQRNLLEGAHRNFSAA